MTAGADFLAQIVAEKRRQVAEARRSVSPAQLEARCAQVPPPRDLAAALRAAAGDGRVPVIAEVKLASPARGELGSREERPPAGLARLYAAGGAAAVSVLTDGRFFGGSLEDLAAVRAAVPLPVLRKDFLVDEYQVLEARAAGADAVLLIVAALAEEELARLYRAATALGMGALVEVHTAGELERALALGAPLLAVNNRNLHTLEVDLGTTERLAPLVPSDRLVVSASGLRGPREVRRAWQAGARAVLVGEALVTSPDPAGEVAALCRALREAD